MHPGATDLGLEPVCDLGALEQARRPQVVEQIGGAGLGGGQQRAAGRSSQHAPERRVRQRQLVGAPQRDPVLREHAREQRRGPRDGSEHDRDLPGRHPLAQQLEHPAGHELGLGALASGLQQRDRRSGIDPFRAGLEQVSFQVVERHP